ncbi:MAG TPA: PqqD family protein [Longimicrobium sp.]|nr:PqqD family protein [Longimicrobium sp.]
MSSTRIQIHGHVRSIIDPDGAVVLDLRKGRYYSLNSVGAEIWTLIEAGRSVPEVEAHLRDALGAPPETVGADVAGFLADLADRELIDVGT